MRRGSWEVIEDHGGGKGGVKRPGKGTGEEVSVLDGPFKLEDVLSGSGTLN